MFIVIQIPNCFCTNAVFSLFRFLFIFCCLTVSVYEDVPRYHKYVEGALYFMVKFSHFKVARFIQNCFFLQEMAILIQFLIELLLRFWSSSCRIKYHGFEGKKKFMKKPFTVIGNILHFVIRSVNYKLSYRHFSGSHFTYSADCWQRQLVFVFQCNLGCSISSNIAFSAF